MINHRQSPLSLVFILYICLLFPSCSLGREKDEGESIKKTPDNIKYSGVRSSSYGIRPFPGPSGWEKAIKGIRDRFPGSAAAAVWILGIKENDLTCHLEFPGNGKEYEHILFSSKDRHEEYLSFFDSHEIKVFLQVEPMHGDVLTLIDLVLNRYGHHPCVTGFGVDVEWYREADRPQWGIPVDDATARLWEERVKSHNPSYRLFLKHWDRGWMPPVYRGGIIFVSDSQMFKSIDEIVEEFSRYWADFFFPNPVCFQVGYPSDRIWWEKLKNPPLDIGTAVAEKVKQEECGIFWVDFTLRDIFPDI